MRISEFSGNTSVFPPEHYLFLEDKSICTGSKSPKRMLFSSENNITGVHKSKLLATQNSHPASDILKLRYVAPKLEARVCRKLVCYIEHLWSRGLSFVSKHVVLSPICHTIDITPSCELHVGIYSR